MAAIVKPGLHIDTAPFRRRLGNMSVAIRGPEGVEPLRELGADLVTRIISKNPVKTGRSRAGWYPSARALGAPVSGSGGEGSYDETASGALKKVVLTNEVPYTILLEMGSSVQAPLGMVRVSMAEIRSTIPKRVLKKTLELWERSRFR